MRAVLQRVSRASVTVDGACVGRIDGGWLILLGVGRDDGPEDVAKMADKVLNLRAFADDEGKMNRNVLDVRGGLLLVSQFTVMADCRSGRRPGFADAADPATAESLYLRVRDALAASGLDIATGVFRADMQVELVNDGPVTFLIDTRKAF